MYHHHQHAAATKTRVNVREPSNALQPTVHRPRANHAPNVLVWPSRKMQSPVPTGKSVPECRYRIDCVCANSLVAMEALGLCRMRAPLSAFRQLLMSSVELLVSHRAQMPMSSITTGMDELVRCLTESTNS